MRLEKIVREVMHRHKKDENFAAAIQETVIGFPTDNIYNRSYQEALNRPITVDFSDAEIYQKGVVTTYTQSSVDSEKPKRYSTLINGNSDTEKEPEKEPLMSVNKPNNNELKKLQNTSSGFGTQKTESKGRKCFTFSIECNTSEFQTELIIQNHIYP